MRARVAGFIVPPQVYVLLFIGLVVAAGYWYVTGVIDENAELRIQNSALVSANEALKAEAKVSATLATLENERLRIVMDRQTESAVHAEQEKQRVDAERLANVSKRKAALVEKLAHKAIDNNREAISCQSDLSAADCPAVR